jgi:hypothetical protein
MSVENAPSNNEASSGTSDLTVGLELIGEQNASEQIYGNS